MKPNLDDLYAVLCQWVKAGKPQTYTRLSHDYQAKTGDWFEPHGSWDFPLGDINNRLAAMGAPALSALVILQEKNEPGVGFWGCAPNVPLRPRNDIKRLTVWNSIVQEVFEYNWPPLLL